MPQSFIGIRFASADCPGAGMRFEPFHQRVEKILIHRCLSAQEHQERAILFALGLYPFRHEVVAGPNIADAADKARQERDFLKCPRSSTVTRAPILEVASLIASRQA